MQVSLLATTSRQDALYFQVQASSFSERNPPFSGGSYAEFLAKWSEKGGTEVPSLRKENIGLRACNAL
jgi:hypothetical protein